MNGTGDSGSGTPIRGILVVGMHRSGTSAVTGVIAALGVTGPGPDDRLEWAESNPEHWESKRLTRANDVLLDSLGGSWHAPPDLPEGWHHDAPVDRAELLADYRAAYPTDSPSVWKDPRLSLLLPLWRELIPGPQAVLLIWRDPLAVAASLTQRDGLEVADGLALWERYNRCALEVAAGHELFVCRYERIVDAPVTGVAELGAWLESLSGCGLVPSPEQRRAAAAAAIAPPGHARAADHPVDPSPEEPGVVLTPQRRLADTLASLEGPHTAFVTPDLGAESAWTSALLADRRRTRAAELEGTYAYLQKRARVAERTVHRLERSRVWRTSQAFRRMVRRPDPEPTGPASTGEAEAPPW